jgi:hypothetical protein
VTLRAFGEDAATHEETHEPLALLKILALGGQQAKRGEMTPVGEAVKCLRAKGAMS